MSRSEKRGPSNCLFLWTLYALLVITAVVAIALLVIGDLVTEASATWLLWRVVKTLKDLAGK
jgi:uncharacterized membrane protein